MKPPYRVPSMVEIAAIPSNGLTVASTFAGCGGSCLGYRMAGFRVIWANEFIPVARACYRLNFPETILDGRDIRRVRPEDVLKAIGKAKGEIDIFDGSPPCQAFSMAGKRHHGWGKGRKYENGITQCNEDLFREYIRMVEGLMPRVFVAENVSGLVKGVAKGYFLEILAALKACGYRVRAKLLDAQWLGVPQMRQRIIFIGVREDLGRDPEFPKPLSYRYSVRDALPEISRAINDSKGMEGTKEIAVDGEPWPAIRAGGGGHQLGWQIEGSNGFNGHHPSSMSDPLPTVQVDRSLTIYRDRRGAFGNDGVCTDGPSPTILNGSVRTHWIERSSSTIQADAGKRTSSSWDHGTCMIEDGPRRRKLTIAELRRICAFPDDFKLVGTYAQQWARLGNAVPPLMMRAVAGIIRDRIFTG